MNSIEQNSIESVHSFETAAHESFLRSLYYCAEETKSYESADFTQCIKAAGVNFNYSYYQFARYKNAIQQARSIGYRN